MREFFPNTPKIIAKDEALEVIRSSPRFAYMYAMRWIQEPFPEGETTIARSGKYSYLYALNVLQGRFLEGEKAINRSVYKNSYKKEILDKENDKENNGQT